MGSSVRHEALERRGLQQVAAAGRVPDRSVRMSGTRHPMVKHSYSVQRQAASTYAQARLKSHHQPVPSLPVVDLGQPVELPAAVAPLGRQLLRRRTCWPLSTLPKLPC